MSTRKPPTHEFHAPGYVGAFFLAGVFYLFTAVAVCIVQIKQGGGFPWEAALLLGSAVWSFIFAQMAQTLAFTCWQTERLAYDLHPAIAELQRQADERTARAAAQEREVAELLERRKAQG